MRIHTDCERVQIGVKDILDATVKGQTPTKREHIEVRTTRLTCWQSKGQAVVDHHKN